MQIKTVHSIRMLKDEPKAYRIDLTADIGYGDERLSFCYRRDDREASTAAMTEWLHANPGFPIEPYSPAVDA